MAEKLPFEKIFPYFSYRWKYNDGQYSAYAPFTKAAFISKEPNVKDLFKKGHNTSVVNDLKVINLKDIPRGGPDVVAIDILYRESISSTVYILKTINIAEKNEDGTYKPSRGGFESVKLTKRAFSAALPANQLSRHFDNVPRSAKAQEMTANRLMYGNYVQKYNIPNQLKIKINTNQTPQPKNGPSVKTNRVYEVGVVYMDKYGRQSNILTQKTPTDEEEKEGSSIYTNFSYLSRLNLTASIESEHPSWAKWYKYYVKDVSGEHFNLTAFNVYNDGSKEDINSENVYIQFNSTDRNKIHDETILIPKRHNFDGDDVFFEEESRHPVLDIENEAPDIVKSQVVERETTPIGSIYGNTADTVTSLLDGTIDANGFGIGATNIFIGSTINLPIMRQLNEYISGQDADQTLFSTGSANDKAQQTIDISGYTERLCMEFQDDSPAANALPSKKILVDSITFGATTSNPVSQQRNVFKFELSNQLNDDFIVQSDTGLSRGFELDGLDKRLRFYKLGLSEEGQDKLKGSFFVKVPREVSDNPTITTLPIGQSVFNEDGNIKTIKEFNFETAPAEDSNLDLYWESSNVFTTKDNPKGTINNIEWANCIASSLSTAQTATNRIYLESTKLFDKFNSVEMAKGTRVLTTDPSYAEERRKTGIIFSGLYNSKTGINELNQFIEADGITKDLEPNYGGIQRLFALDTNLLAFAEEKVFRILADKDALFNADDGVNVTATNLVLGQAMVYQGNYGIATNPESLAYFNNQLYFTDARKGVVLQLTPANGQIFPISSRGMSNFFRDRLITSDIIVGVYDGVKKQYVLSLQYYNHLDPAIGTESLLNETNNLTIAYSPRSETWTSRFSFIPESGLTIGNKFYTFKNAKLYEHYSNDSSALYNNFYGTQYNSHVELVFNDNPSAVKEFLTLSYEGTSGWDVGKIDTESDDAALTSTWPFAKKENKYFAPIVSQENYYGSTDQSLGSATADDGSTVYVQGTRDKSGIKGFYNKVRLENDSTSKAELFAVNTENFISQT